MMKRMLCAAAGLAALLNVGCGGEAEELETLEEPSQEQPGHEEPSHTAFAYDCSVHNDGTVTYHHHTVDWGSTQGAWYWNTCGGGPTLSFGTQVCMQSTNNGYSACGEWWVPTFVPSVGQHVNIKIQALNGH